MTNDQSSHQPKMWSSGGVYEPFMGRWSRLVAQRFIPWLEVPPEKRWLDVGCGTGALSHTILQTNAPAMITGVDRSEGHVAFSQDQLRDERVEFKVGDAQNLPFETGAFDVAVSGLVLNFMPQPNQAVEEMRRVVKPGGIVSVYVWDYAGKMQMLRQFWDAAGTLDPRASSLDEGQRFPMCNPQALMALFQTAKLSNIEVQAIEISTDFKDFDDYWLPFLGGEAPASNYTMALSEAQRTALRERIRAELPSAPDGSIPLVARAWAVRGIS